MGETAEQKAAKRQAELKAAKDNAARDKRQLLRELTSNAAEVQVLLAKAPSKELVNQIGACLDSWKNVLSSLSHVDTKLMKLLPSDLSENEVIAQEEIICADYAASKSEWNKAVGSYHTIKESLEQPIPEPSGRLSVGQSSFMNSSFVMPLMNVDNLPVPKFDGDFANFPEFFAEFTSTIEKNECLDDCQRLKFLKRAMTGKVERLLADVGTEGELYKPTMKGLYDTYYNRRRIIAEHFATITDLPVVKNSEIRESMDKVKRAIRGLKVCGVNVEAISPFVAFLVARKIPERLRADWDTSNLDYTAYQSFESLAKFLNSRCLSYESSLAHKVAVELPKDTKRVVKGGSNPAKGSSSGVAKFTGSSSSLVTCPCCSEDHYLDQCKTFNAKSVLDRFEFVKGIKLCLKCFRKGHSVSNCRSNFNCKSCKGLHHTLLHRESSTVQPKGSEISGPSDQPKETEEKKSFFTFSNKAVLLSTAVVTVKSPSRTEKGRVLLDQGSETSLITREFCSRLKLELFANKNPTILVGITDSPKELNKVVRCVLKSRFSDFSIAIEAEVIDKIPYSVNKTTVVKEIGNLSFNFAESFDLPYDTVDVLLGSEYYEFCMAEKRHFIEDICLKESRFGFVISGATKRSFLAQRTAFCGLTNGELDDRLRKFFDYEIPSSNKNDRVNDHVLIENHYVETVSIDELTGRFVVRLPTRDSIKNLTSSFEKAKALLKNSEKRRSREEHEMYCSIFKEYEDLGHMRRIENVNADAYFIPYHLVKMSRIVFNASFSYDNTTSLNSHLLAGPVLQPPLISHIIRFRIFVVVISADIFRMYRSILVHQEDWKYQTILFRRILSQCIEFYELMTLTNGIGPASYIATRCLEFIANTVERGNSPIDLREFSKLIANFIEIVVECIRNNFYMDNFMRGFNSVNEATLVVDAIIRILGHYGFKLCKFQSNSPEFLSTLDPQLIDNLKTKFFSEMSESYVTVLGLVWLTESDELKICIRSCDVPLVVTKRVVLSHTSMLYDVLGILSPFSIRAKLLLQELWKEGRSWDEPVSDELRTTFIEYKNELELLEAYSIPRCYCYSSEVVSQQLIGFCDASTKAYCAVVYLRSVDKEGTVYVSFVMAKTRIAPIKPVQIHRLELLAMELLSSLIVEVRAELNVTNVFLFSDSKVALSWLNLDRSKLLVFVANRVKRVLDRTEIRNWYYVNGKNNPADAATRGMKASDLLTCSIWKSGPCWLNTNEFVTFVQNNSRFSPVTDLPELKVEKTVNVGLVKDSIVTIILDKFASINKCISVIAYVLRFIRNVKKRVELRRSKEIVVEVTLVDIDKVEMLSVAERNSSLTRIIIEAQMSAFPKEYQAIFTKNELPRDGKLRTLDPFLDNEGQLRVRGRVSNSAFSFDTKFPIIIPVTCRFIRLYVEHVHYYYFHASRSFIFNFIQCKFWVVGSLSSLIKNIIHHCVLCTRIRAVTVEQIMADLPSDRVSVGRPFTNTGVDFSGYMQARCVNHRSTKYYKVYIAFFVCFSTRAVHLELVEGLSADAFVDAFARFVYRRGVPRVMYSDNGTNFVGFSNLLCKQHPITWKFIPSRSPHQGGLWEAAVKAGKSCILKAIGSQILSFNELNTLLIKVEAILNSRPLSYRRTNNEIEPLTPGHFLIGTSLLENPVEDECQASLKTRYRLWRSIVDSFWSTWRKSYLNQLQVRAKWNRKNSNLQINDVVVYKLPNTGIMEWPMGLVVNVYPDSEGYVRTVTIRLSNGAMRKTAVKNLILLATEGTTTD